jgi:hypothetical protein
MLQDRSSPATEGLAQGGSRHRGETRFVAEPVPAMPAGTPQEIVPDPADAEATAPELT